MGMFDTIQVAKDNIFGLPFDSSGFQTQTLDSTLTYPLMASYLM